MTEEEKKARVIEGLSKFEKGTGGFLRLDIIGEALLSLTPEEQQTIAPHFSDGIADAQIVKDLGETLISAHKHSEKSD
ncbi:hypothetical protein KKC56_02920 [Patescibacteria group bacterium]|nr:hypothetical protein [Patescibacteria group bacterium]MBU1684390.1 hypothetical protein [Patescibacteria group bacterium]MBU1987158.1 hypothetical protein [Patescibacteria group bacterium]